jgi:hypothetical protein
MEHRETQLRDELEQLQAALAEKESSASQAMSIEMQQTEDDSKLNDETNAKGVRSSDEQELEIIKTELVGFHCTLNHFWVTDRLKQTSMCLLAG